MGRTVLVTGACGYLGGTVLRRLTSERERFGAIVGVDLRAPRAEERLEGVTYCNGDVRDAALRDLFVAHRPQCVIHLASIVSPGKDSSREIEYAVDVLGTENVIEACLAAGTEQIIVSSSGAAYGYHADNPAALVEPDALRGNDVFAYSRHKRLVEEMLARYRETHPELGQLIFRLCTILGARTRNQITALFEKRVLLGVRGASTPFVFIWDEDAAAAIVRGAVTGRTGIYNLAGDGTMTMREIAGVLGKPLIAVPPGMLGTGLGVLKALGLTRYGPEQVDFLRYRPVLDNARLKSAFGFTPSKTSREVFAFFARENLGVRTRD